MAPLLAQVMMREYRASVQSVVLDFSCPLQSNFLHRAHHQLWRGLRGLLSCVQV